jgi:hypothetical protein
MSKGFNFYSKQPYNFIEADKIHDKKRMNRTYKKLIEKNIRENNRTINLFGGCYSCSKSSSLVGGCESCGNQEPELYYYLSKS